MNATRIAAATLLVLGGASLAHPPYLTAWVARYPSSTLPARMQSLAGDSCLVCHGPPSYSSPGTCYRMDLRTLLDSGLTIEQALDAADTMDSDGDGVANGLEILLPRADVAGQVGYHPGLIGPRGTGPCNADPTHQVTGKPETPPFCYPNCDASVTPPVLNVQDFSCFLQRFTSGDAYANCDHSTAIPTLNVADFSCFLQSYAAGCP